MWNKWKKEDGFNEWKGTINISANLNIVKIRTNKYIYKGK